MDDRINFYLQFKSLFMLLNNDDFVHYECLIIEINIQS